MERAWKEVNIRIASDGAGQDIVSNHHI